MKIKITDAIILAAGTGKRFKKDLPKQFTKIIDQSSVEISLSKLINIKSIRNIYLVINKKYNYLFKNTPTKVKIIIGGRTRSKSVFNSLAHINTSSQLPDNILIHDSVRPCVNDEEIKKLIKTSNNLKTGLALGYPLTHALKRVIKKINVVDHLTKNNLWLSFTPQIFNFKKLFASYKKVVENKYKIDDDIQAMSLLSYKVGLIFSSNRNIKLTYQDDLAVIKDLLR